VHHAGGDRQPPPLGHRVTGVQADVHERLVDLAVLTGDARVRRRRFEHDLDGGGEDLAERRLQFCEQIVYGNGRELDVGFAGDADQLLDEGSPPLRRVLDGAGALDHP